MGKLIISTGPWLQVRKLLVYHRVNLHFPMVFLWFLALPLDQTWLGNPLERNSAKPRRGTAGDLSSADVFTTLGMLRDDW